VRSQTLAKSALLHLMLSVLNSVEPLLPASVVFIRVMALVRLKKQNILVSDQQRMMIAGHLDVVLFDKTGTLTGDQVGFCFGF
jgi:magnesium-transporting ATPase (P-type)